MFSKLFEHKFLMVGAYLVKAEPFGFAEKNLPCSLRSRGFFFGKVLPVIPFLSGEGDYQKARKGSVGKVVRRFKHLIFSIMETNAKNNGQANVNTVKADKTPKFVAGNPVNAVSKAEETKPQEQPKAEQTTPQPQAEPTKKEIKFQLEQQKPALNLEQTLKKIKDLSRLSNQREKLLSTIEDLDGFEVKQLDDAEETNLNHFQRCELKITDDNGNTFSTKNPFIINEVSTNIKALCEGKLSEVEAQISLTL